jgi:hypothetical protein
LQPGGPILPQATSRRACVQSTARGIVLWQFPIDVGEKFRHLLAIHAGRVLSFALLPFAAILRTISRAMTLSRSFTRSMSRIVRACGLALLTLGLFAPAANAQHCGRYVVAEGEFRQQVARLLEGGAEARLPGLPTAPEPCKGASCSGQPAAPASPTATPTPPCEDWACPVVLAEPKAEPSLPDAPRSVDARPIGRGPSIFHPPRLALPSA